MVWIDGFDNVDDVIQFLIHDTPERTTNDSCHDALLVFDFFPMLGPSFAQCPNFEEEQVERFKETFGYERFGLDREAALKRIEKYRSIDRILDTLVMLMPAHIKQELMKRYLLEVWFNQNSKGNLEFFKSSLNRDYWAR